jgi:hypothetical protein
MGKIPELRAGEPIANSRETINQVIRVINNIRVVNGTASLSGDSLLIQTQPTIPPDRFFWAEITASSGIATSGKRKQWAYSWNQVHWDGPDLDDWTAAGSSGAYNAYNTIENINIAQDRQGDGVSASGLRTGYNFYPAQTGVVVLMNRQVDSEGNEAFWFQYENGVDGSCT